MKSDIQRARNQCANWLPDNKCMGIDIRDDGSLVLMKQVHEHCVFASKDRNASCLYFETCVISGSPAKKCASPTCQNEAPSGCRYCRDCSEKRAKEQRRTYISRKRSGCINFEAKNGQKH